MSKNIFEGVKFGDKFVTRDEKIVIYLTKDKLYSNNSHLIVNSSDSIPYKVDDTGKVVNIKSEHWLDIVSRYQEPIDERKLDELAMNYADIATLNDREWKIVYDAYDAGYRKALVE